MKDRLLNARGKGHAGIRGRQYVPTVLDVTRAGKVARGIPDTQTCEGAWQQGRMLSTCMQDAGQSG